MTSVGLIFRQSWRPFQIGGKLNVCLRRISRDAYKQRDMSLSASKPFVPVLEWFRCLPHPAQKIYATVPCRNNMLPIRMNSTGIEPTIHIQGTQTCSRVCIPHLERLVIGGRHDEVSRWTDRTASHFIRMPDKRAPLLSFKRSR